MMIAEGDLVYVRSTWSGSYTGTFRGVAVSGRAVTVVYSNVYRRLVAHRLDVAQRRIYIRLMSSSWLSVRSV